MNKIFLKHRTKHKTRKKHLTKFLPKSLCVFEQKDCADKDLPIIPNKALLTHLQKTDCYLRKIKNKIIKFILNYSKFIHINSSLYAKRKIWTCEGQQALNSIAHLFHVLKRNYPIQLQHRNMKTCKVK